MPLARRLSAGGLAALALLVAGQVLHQSKNTIVVKSVAAGVTLEPEIGPHRQLKVFENFRFNLEDLPLIGNPEAPHVIVSLFDYTCYACRLMHAHLTEVNKTSSNELAIVVLPTPLDGACNPTVKQIYPEHTNACEYARIALAVWKANRNAFAQFDGWMFSQDYPPPLVDAMQFAKQVVGSEAFENALKSEWISGQLNSNVAIYKTVYSTTGQHILPQLLVGTNITLGSVARVDRLYALLAEQLGFGWRGSGTPAELGKPAPPLKPEQWARQGPVVFKEGKGAKIYVLVFLETWCDSCTTSLPRLAELQKRFKDDGVVLIGMTVEPITAVKPFLDAMGDSLDFAVAVDNNRNTFHDYMTAFGESIIPHAFLIDKSGVLAWHGHPLAGLDQAIEEMLGGNFDLEGAKKVANAEKLKKQYFQIARSHTNSPDAERIGNQIVMDGAKNPWLLNNFAWNILTDSRSKFRNLPLALRAAKLADQASGGNNSAFADTYARALFENGDVPEAIKVQKRALEKSQDERQRAAVEATLRKYEAKTKD